MDYRNVVKMLPSFLSSCAQGHADLGKLRANIQQVRSDLSHSLQEKIDATHSKTFMTPEVQELTRKIAQIDRFLESIRG